MFEYLKDNPASPKWFPVEIASVQNVQMFNIQCSNVQNVQLFKSANPGSPRWFPVEIVSSNWVAGCHEIWKPFENPDEKQNWNEKIIRCEI